MDTTVPPGGNDEALPHKDLLALIDDPEDPERTQARNVVNLLLEHASQLRDFNLKYATGSSSSNDNGTDGGGDDDGDDGDATLVNGLDQRLRELQAQREKCLQRLERLDSNQEQLDLLWKELRPLSQKVQRAHRVAQQDGEYAQCLKSALALNWAILQDLVLTGGSDEGNDNDNNNNRGVSLALVEQEDDPMRQQKLNVLTQWRETYLGGNVLDMSVLDNGAGKDDDNNKKEEKEPDWNDTSSSMGVADMAKGLYQSGRRGKRYRVSADESKTTTTTTDTENQGGEMENLTDTCDTCGWFIGFSDARYGCVVCQKVQCEVCFEYFSDVFHKDHGKRSNLEMVLEYRPASMVRAKLVLCKTLAESLYTTLLQWSGRPCLCRFPDNDGTGRQEWLTYLRVLKEAQKRVTKLVELLGLDLNNDNNGNDNVNNTQKKLVALLFPAASLDFYLWDIACILCGITTIGIPTPPPNVEDWPVPSLSCVISSSEIRQQFADSIPDSLVWVDSSSADDLPRFDTGKLVKMFEREDPNGDFTVYMTSGTTGKPKLIPESRRSFINQLFSKSFHRKPLCTISFLPPCWGTDRDKVYWAIANGHRVGFAPPNPSLPQIVQAMEIYQPTSLVVPPTVAQFFCSLGKGATDLGGRLEYLAVGGAPVAEGTLQELRDMYGIADVREGYGSTEVGGIAWGGWFHDEVRERVRIRDPDYSGEGDDNNDGWLDPKKEGIIGELWVGDINTNDIVELTSHGQKVKVLGRSADAASYKLANGKWAALVDIEDEITRACCPDLFDEVMAWVNRNGVLVLLGCRSSPRWKDVAPANAEAILEEVIKRSSLTPEMQPKAILLSTELLPKTVTRKIQRGKVIDRHREEADSLDAKVTTASHHHQQRVPLDAADVAAKVLGREVDRTKTFNENGGTSLDVVLWLKELEKAKIRVSDWRSLLGGPLDGHDKAIPGEDDIVVVEPPPAVDASADSILLTGATGFFGRQVLQRVLAKETDAVVVCLVRDASSSLIEESDRVLVVNSVPLERKYRSVIHLAANVNHILGYNDLKADNVDLTEELLKLRLAPMTYCSTISTQRGHPPFADGYTQTKWVSEQMVLRSGGKSFWPPLLVWGNEKDWLTRLLQHCLRTSSCPSSAGFVVVCPVEVAAQDLLDGRPCSLWDLDLDELFARIHSSGRKLDVVPMQSFILRLQNDIESPAYPILPLLQRKETVGNPRSHSLELLPIDVEQILVLIREKQLLAQDST